MKILKRNTGFTLLEVLFAVSILVIVGVIAFNGFYGGFSLWNTLDLKIQLQQEARKAINSVVSELRKTDMVQTDLPEDGELVSEIKFDLPALNTQGNIIVNDGTIDWNGGSVHFHLDSDLDRLIKTVTPPECSGNLCQYQLGGLGGGQGGVRFYGGSGSQQQSGDFPVANYIEEILFQEFGPDSVRVQVIAKKPNFLGVEQSITLTSTIKLRN